MYVFIDTSKKYIQTIHPLRKIITPNILYNSSTYMHTRTYNIYTPRMKTVTRLKASKRAVKNRNGLRWRRKYTRKGMQVVH
jgi:hypothetical protein